MPNRINLLYHKEFIMYNVSFGSFPGGFGDPGHGFQSCPKGGDMVE